MLVTLDRPAGAPLAVSSRLVGPFGIGADVTARTGSDLGAALGRAAA